MGKYDKIEIQHICLNICSGGTPKSTVTEYYGGNIPWLNTKEINFCRIYETERTITDEGLNNSSAKWVPANTVIVAMYGATAGKTAIAKIPLTTNQACCNLNIDSAKADYRFVYYALYNDYAYLASLANGGAQQNLNAQQIKEFEIPFPPLKEQKRIADILSSLDDKIELNRRINGNLEQQAQALFKAWFVDFEPFKDGKFVDSELGRIPEGWNIVEANHFMTISKDSINPTKNPMCLYTHYSIPAFDEALTPEIQFGHKIKSNKFLVRSGMTLFSKLNPRIKRIWFINEASDNSICSTEFIPYESLGQNSYFLYCYLNSSMFYSQAMSLVNGATGSHQRFSPNETLKFLFAYKKEIVEEFNVLVAPTLKEMSELSLETRKISKLRDTLLPRLMSGELNVNTITE